MLLLMVNLRPLSLNTGRIIFLIGIFTSIATVLAVAQVGDTSPAYWNAAVRADLAFDVVSVRLSNAGPNHGHLQVPPGGDVYEAMGMPLGYTILMAYFPFRMGSKERIVGAPAWVWDDRYDFVGKVGEPDLTAWHKLTQHLFVENPMLQTMLQNALADRCKMAVHRVPAQVDGYALVTASRGPNRRNLVESKPDDVVPERAGEIALGGRMIPIYSKDDPGCIFIKRPWRHLF